MSHEVKLHEAQTAILRELLFIPQAGFAQLQKQTKLTSDHFTFHINRLMELGFITRTGHGVYGLSAKGKEYANRLDTDERTVERQGKIAVLIVPVRTGQDGARAYMVQRRLKHPFWGYYGFMTGKLRWGETILAGAARELVEETGMTADLSVAALYHKMDYDTDGESLEDKHFYVIRAINPRGTMNETFEGGENSWCSADKVSSLTPAFSAMDTMMGVVERAGMSLLELKFDYTAEQY